jgi:hypothetical protein
VPDPLHEGGLTVAIYKRKSAELIERERQTGCGEPDKKTERVADFAFQPSDSLAQMIVDAWVDKGFRDELLNPKNAKKLLAERGIYLEQPVVITEEEYNNHYEMKSDKEVIFVLPDKRRADLSPPKHMTLLETARLLMACTPNGI